MTDEPTLYTASANGFSATSDAWARDPLDGHIYLLSMVGPQTALKAIWAAMLKRTPDPLFLIEGADGMAVSGGYKRCSIPPHTVGTWTTKTMRLPVSGGFHSLVYTKLAEYTHDAPGFLLLSEADEPPLEAYYRFLNRRTSMPLHPSWASWLWTKAERNSDVLRLESAGINAWLCTTNEDRLRVDVPEGIANGVLTIEEGGAA